MTQRKTLTWIKKKSALPFKILIVAVLLVLNGSTARQASYAGSPIVISFSSDLSFEGKAAEPAGAGSQDGRIARVHTVVMSNKEPFYSPPSLVITVGDMVKWVNSERSDTHSIHERSGTLISPDVTASQDWSFRFTRAGEYNYTCRFHPWMQGRIVVKPKSIDILELPLPGESSSLGLALDSTRGDMWLIIPGTPVRIGRLPREGDVALSSLPSAIRAVTSFCFAPDGHLWLIDEISGKLLEFDPSASRVKEHAFSESGAKPLVIAASGQGLVWFFDAASSSFASLDPKTGQVLKRPAVKIRGKPVKMAVTREGHLWFIEETRNCVGMYDLNNEQIKEYVLSDQTHLVALDVTPKGQVWLSDAGRNKISKIENGWATDYTVPSRYSLLQGLVVDGEGSVWFAEALANKIGRLRDGRFDEYLVPTAGSRPTAIGLDSEGNLWFTQPAARKIGKISSHTIRSLSTADLGQAEDPSSRPPHYVGSQADALDAHQPVTNSSHSTGGHHHVTRH